MMACIIAFSGVGGSYIQAKAANGVPDVLWNDDVEAWENIVAYMSLFLSASGMIIAPNAFSAISAVSGAALFSEFMLSDGYSQEQVDGVLDDGGFIRDGVTQDDDGNVTYSDEVSDLFHDYIEDYLNNSCGYFNFKTLTPDNVDVTHFSQKDQIDNFAATVENLGLVYIHCAYTSFYFGEIPTENLYIYSSLSSLVFGDDKIYTKYSSNPLQFVVLNDDWTTSRLFMYSTEPDSSTYSCLEFDKIYTSSDLYVSSEQIYGDLFSRGSVGINSIFSSDGRTVKVWYDIEAYKNYTVNYQPYYVTNSWNNYDSSVDNSTTITNAEYQYYTDNSQTIYQTIQNNIDNSVTNTGSTLTEADVQNIVNDAVNQIKNEIQNNSGSGDSGSGDSGDSEDSGGTGVGDLIDGIGKIFDTILSLIGKLMGVVADFTQSILDLFSGFTTFTDGFSDFLAGAFTFIPPEVWDIVKVGLSLIVLLAVIKFLRK